MDSSHYKDLKVKRGFTYHYYYIPATPGKPTLFFIHGYPSSSSDWAKQIAHFQPKGYGILAPDCLGYGGTDKPKDVESFRYTAQAGDLMEIVEAENPSEVIGIGHDWGSSLLSFIAYNYQDRLAGIVWIAVGYIPPRPQVFNLDAHLAHFQQLAGSDVFGYWEFFNKDDAHVLVEKNIDSFLQLLYPAEPELWIDWMCPRGKIEEWVQNNTTPGQATWLTKDEYAAIRKRLLEGGMQSPMNYYKAWIRNINLEDMKKLPEDKWQIKRPALYVAATRDYVCSPKVYKPQTLQYAPHADVVEIACGHWVQMEATEELNTVLEKWISSKH